MSKLEQKAVFNHNEAAAYIGYKPSSLYNLIYSGQLTPRKRGGATRGHNFFLKSDLDKFVGLELIQQVELNPVAIANNAKKMIQARHQTVTKKDVVTTSPKKQLTEVVTQIQILRKKILDLEKVREYLTQVVDE